MTNQQIELSGQQLFEACETGITILPLTKTYLDITIDDAYQIQQELKKRHIAAGRKLTGRKVGLTSKAMQKMANVFEPDYGFLFDSRYYVGGGTIPAGILIQPKVECELAFVLNRDLSFPQLTAQDVINSTSYVVASMEIIDKRYHDFYGHICDNVADNAAFGAYVLGDKIADPKKLDMELIGLTLEINGKQMNTGVGAAVLGNPAESVAWLAKRMIEVGMPLKAGELVLSGSFIAAEPIFPGDFISAKFSELGTVSIHMGTEHKG